MARDGTIKIEVEAEGTTEAARAIGGVSGALGTMDDRAKAAATATAALAARQTAAATQAIAFASRMQGVASAVQGLVGQLGGQSRTAGLIGASIATGAQFAQLGMALGPGGALVGGIVGALIPALGALTAAQSASRAEAEARLSAIRDREIPSWSALAAAIRSTAEETADIAALRAGTRDSADQQGFIDQANAILAQQVETRIELERQRSSLINLSDAAHTLENTWRALHDEASVEQEVEGLTRALARQREITRLAQDEARARVESANTLPMGRDMPTDPNFLGTTPRPGGARRARVTDIGDTSMSETRGIASELLGEEEARTRSLADAERARHDAFKSDMAEKTRLIQEQSDAESAAMEAHREQAEANAEFFTAMAERETEEQRTYAAVAINTIQSMAEGIGAAISKVAESNATAEEGAKIALAATLDVVGQTAGALAGLEFGKALASYPDVGGMAIHAAAGVLLTGVAIGLGQGSSALNKDVATSQANRAEKEKPERPEGGGAKGGQQKGGDVIIQWNSPVVTAGTRAELGREMRAMVRSADLRFGG